jgi:sulfonate transport system substrate-binding protein
VLKRTWMTALAVALLLGVAACGDDDAASTEASGATTAAATDDAATTAAAGDSTAATTAESSGEQVTLRLGYFPNVTHATALVGVESGTFAAALGDNVKLETQTFNAGPEAVEALFAEALDATFIGPNPAINAYAQSNGEAVRIISGSTSGGASFVVQPDITGPENLAGTKLATPQLGGTQDVALRAWLAENGLETDTSGGGDVSILPQENGATLDAFKAGEIDGAWLPEPWATRLVLEGGAKVLFDERDIWPEGQFVTTHLIVRTAYLDEHPDVVKKLLEGQVQATELVNSDATAAQAQVNIQIEAITGKALDEQVLATAWEHLEFTVDPVASSLQTSADHAIGIGLLDDVDLTSPGIYDLALLNEVLAANGQPAVEGL